MQPSGLAAPSGTHSASLPEPAGWDTVAVMSGKRRVLRVVLVGLLWLPVFGAGGALLLTPLFVLSMAVAEDPVLTGNRITPVELTTASTAMAVTFPPTTRFVGYQSCSPPPWGGWYIKLKVRMPRTSLPAFLASPAFTGVTFDTPWRWVGNDPNSVWDGEFTPERPKQFRSQRVLLPPGSSLRVLIDDDNSATATVYLFWLDPALTAHID